MRALEALSTRKRYLRGSTLRYGQAMPLTTTKSPKNSGARFGWYGVPGAL